MSSGPLPLPAGRDGHGDGRHGAGQRAGEDTDAGLFFETVEAQTFRLSHKADFFLELQ